jgi:hypothetical protein
MSRLLTVHGESVYAPPFGASRDEKHLRKRAQHVVRGEYAGVLLLQT